MLHSTQASDFGPNYSIEHFPPDSVIVSHTPLSTHTKQMRNTKLGVAQDDSSLVQHSIGDWPKTRLIGWWEDEKQDLVYNAATNKKPLGTLYETENRTASSYITA